MEKIIVRIPDLTCASCVQKIEQVMRHQEGVIWAVVNFAAGQATILFDPSVFNHSRFIQAVNTLGFQITSLDRSGDYSIAGGRRRNPWAGLQEEIGALRRSFMHRSRSLLSTTLFRSSLRH